MPDTTDLTVLGEGHDIASADSLQELWDEFEQNPDTMHQLRRDYSPYIPEYEHEYNQVQVQWRDRGATGFMNDARTRQMFCEMEHWIENVIGEE